ncbi:hypothetical protein ACFOWZ_30010 [Lentzea rhizosphaerae]|uniref:Alpha amylase inhibitor n=1 Tax=Lentzea rhizosphaerae TaxID=2041025 RepID=A0ABV8C154_9PSEU
MSKTRNRALAVLGLAAVLSGFAVPASASEPLKVSCYAWNDQHTYGVRCEGNKEFYFQAIADCTNGQQYRGPMIRGGSGTSYVYCSTYNARYVQGTGQFASTY